MTSFDVSGLPDVPREALRRLQATVGDFLVVGMAAVDLVSRGLGELEASRLTRDVDIAILVESEDTFRRRTSGLTPRTNEGGVHFSLDGDQVDVVPFGGLAIGDAVTLADQRLDVSGLLEADRTALDLTLDEDLVVRVASLPALIVLKLIAWTDRGRETEDKDARDVGLLLRASTSGQFADELFGDDEALEAAAYDPERAGPLRVGRQIADQFSPEVVGRLVALLSGPSGERLLEILGRTTSRSSDHLAGLLLGLESRRTSASPPQELG